MTEGTTTVWRISDATTNTMFIHVTDSDSDVRNTWCLLNLIKYKYEHTHVKVICETEESSARKRRPTIEHLLQYISYELCLGIKFWSLVIRWPCLAVRIHVHCCCRGCIHLFLILIYLHIFYSSYFSFCISWIYIFMHNTHRQKWNYD